MGGWGTGRWVDEGQIGGWMRDRQAGGWGTDRWVDGGQIGG